MWVCLFEFQNHLVTSLLSFSSERKKAGSINPLPESPLDPPQNIMRCLLVVVSPEEASDSSNILMEFRAEQQRYLAKKKKDQRSKGDGRDKQVQSVNLLPNKVCLTR